MEPWELNDIDIVERKPEPKETQPWRGWLIGVICLLVISLIILLIPVVLEFSGGCDTVTRSNTVPFDEMEYVRPDETEIFERLDEIIANIKYNKISYKEQLNSLTVFDTESSNIYTMGALATIKNSLDTTDQYYIDETDFFADFLPKYSQKLEELIVACAQSEYAEDFEADYFGLGYLADYKDGGKITDDSVSYDQKSSDIANRYTAESANPTVEYKGETVFVREALSDPELSYEDYYGILKEYYEKYNEIFGNMYVQEVRANMLAANEMGYSSYLDYMYYSYFRDYTPKQAENYINDIKEYIVPLYEKLQKDGKYSYSVSIYPSSEDETVECMRTVSQMSKKIANIFDFLEEYKLCDLSPSENKENISYTTYIYDYDAPFIMINPSGTDGDILTFAHEFGHFVDGYVNYGHDNGLECSEAASLSMEFLALNYLDECLSKKEVNILTSYKIADVLSTLIYQSYYNEFETRVYELNYEDVTLDNINKISYECAEEFGLTDTTEWEELYSYSWIDIPHIYQSPFYVISYCVSCDVALQIYELELEKKGAGVKTYYDMIDWDWNMTFLENLDRVGLDSPFNEGSIERCSEIVNDYFYG